MKKHIFNAGPCVLPDVVLEKAKKAIDDFNGTGVSVLSVAHRSEEWKAVMDECRSLWRELLHIPDTHEVVFLGGGARLQFLYAAMNFLKSKAAYLDTGRWATEAYEQAAGLCESESLISCSNSPKAYIIASSEDRNYSYIPKNFEVPEDLDYLHITSNNTIYGTEIRTDLDIPVPLIADMSSDILSRPVDVSKYDLIYGGAQKNAGPAGVCFAIVKKTALGKVRRYLPAMLDYRQHIENKSMLNTPPVFSIYVMYENLKWLKSMGGVEKIHQINIEKAERLYAEIDQNPLFHGTAAKEDRSIMNVCFVMSKGYESLEENFIQFAEKHNIVGIKGHRYVGGFRASIYNACTLDDVDALVACMKEFTSLQRL